MFEACIFEPFETAPLIGCYMLPCFGDYGPCYVVYPYGHGYEDGDFYKPELDTKV